LLWFLYLSLWFPGALAALVPLAFASGLRLIPSQVLLQLQGSGLSVRQACLPGGQPQLSSVRSSFAAVQAFIGSLFPCFPPLSPGWFALVPRSSAWVLLQLAAWPSWLAVSGPFRPLGAQAPFFMLKSGRHSGFPQRIPPGWQFHKPPAPKRG